MGNEWVRVQAALGGLTAVAPPARMEETMKETMTEAAKTVLEQAYPEATVVMSPDKIVVEAETIEAKSGGYEGQGTIHTEPGQIAKLEKPLGVSDEEWQATLAKNNLLTITPAEAEHIGKFPEQMRYRELLKLRAWRERQRKEGARIAARVDQGRAKAKAARKARRACR